MPNLNLCQFIGNVGNCETKYAANGNAVFNVSVAVNEKWKDKDGNAQERTEWVRGVAFGKLAEIMDKYVQKGTPIYIAGKMKTDKYQAQDGTDRYSTSIMIDQMQLLGGRSDSAPQQAKPQTTAKEYKEASGGFEDKEIPFNKLDGRYI